MSALDSDALYRYLTPDVLSSFSSTGKSRLVDFLLTPDASSPSSDTMCEIFSELLLALQDGQLKDEQISEFFLLAITDEKRAATLCRVLDVMPMSEKMKEFAKRAALEKTIQSTTFAKNADYQLLIDVGIVPGEALLRQLSTRKRDELYTQKKFNLLHEEFEGFTKLISEFSAILRSQESIFMVDYALDVVELLIGHYCLDPNRVLDILIDVCANGLVGSHKFVLNFFKKSRWWPAVPADNSSLISLDKGGSEVAAKCLGLKIAKFTTERELTETFKLLVALFIKSGFISFSAIYMYLRPSEAEMEKLKEHHKRDLEDKVFKANASALALAAPLADDETTPELAAKSESRRPVNLADFGQNFIVQLLRSFLSTGLYYPSLYILSRYPFLVDIDPEIVNGMHRLLEVMIEPLVPLKSDSSFSQERPGYSLRSANQVVAQDRDLPVLLSFRHNQRIYTKAPVFFYKEWSTGIPKVDDFESLFDLFKSFIKILGVHLLDWPQNYARLCEIGAADLSDCSKERTILWVNIVRAYLLPPVTTANESPHATNLLFGILKHFSRDERFNIYGELHMVVAKNNLHVKIASHRAEKATKDALKRISKENIPQMMRRIAKISYANPLPCFLTILQQIESYDNLNALVVESAGYFNEYGWDNLAFAILMRLTTTGRTTIQEDGLNDRQWIQSLASFIGQICLRYPKRILVASLLTFLVKSFHNGMLSGILVLKELISHMGGIQAITNLTLPQISMINCGSALEQVVYRTIGDKRFSLEESGTTLVDALTQLNVTNELFVLLCHAGAELVNVKSLHLKIIASRKDEVDSVLHLLCTLLGFFGLVAIRPTLCSIPELINDYSVPVSWAFDLWRPFLSLEESSKSDLSSMSSFALTTEGVDESLFLTFWRLRLTDINYSEHLYKRELQKLELIVSGIRESIQAARRDRSVSNSTVNKLKHELTEVDSLRKKIPEEEEEHKSRMQNVTDFILENSASWFDGSEGCVELFLQVCVLPRALHSSFDAVYSATLLLKFREIRIPNFDLFQCLSIVFSSKIFFATIFTCTPTEVENLGLFVATIFASVNDLAEKSDFEDLKALRLKLLNFHSDHLEDVQKALNVAEYMARLNAITYLKNLIGVYPVVVDHCESLIESIKNIAEFERREDLKLSSNALIGHIKSRAKSWKQIWEFAELPEEEKEKHIERRKAIEDKKRAKSEIETSRKLRIEREAREVERKREEDGRRIREEKRRAEIEQRAKEEQEIEKEKRQKDMLAKASSYDETNSTVSRASTRGESASKGRYDAYVSSAPISSTKAKIAEKIKEAKRDYATSEVARAKLNEKLEAKTAETLHAKQPKEAPDTMPPAKAKPKNIGTPTVETKKARPENQGTPKTATRMATPESTATPAPPVEKAKTIPAAPQKSENQTVRPAVTTPVAPAENAKTRFLHNRSSFQAGPPPSRSRDVRNSRDNRKDNTRIERGKRLTPAPSAPVAPPSAPPPRPSAIPAKTTNGPSSTSLNEPLPPPPLPPPSGPEGNKRRQSGHHAFNRKRRH